MNQTIRFAKLTFVTAMVLLSSLSGCTIAPKNAKPRGSHAFDYPKTFSIKSSSDSLNPQSDIRALRNINGLSGSLCYLSWIKTSNPTNTQYRIPILHRLQFSDNNAVKTDAFEFPAYDPSVVGSISWPVFMTHDKCLVRIEEKNTDVGRYQLYEVDLASKKSRMLESELFLFYRVLVSPTGDSYAYATSEPWDESHYRLTVVPSKGKRKIISEERITDAFSWTSRNTLIYPDYPQDLDTNVPSKKNNGYPNIYEYDLQGRRKIIKAGAYRPLMSPNERHLAIFTALVDKGDKHPDSDVPLFASGVGRVNLSVYDLKRKTEHIVTRIYQEYPDLLWSKDGVYLYVIESFYVFSSKTAFCRISSYNTKTREYKLLCKLEQKGEASSNSDLKFKPRFTSVGLGNNKHIILHVPVSASGKNNYRVLAIGVKTGARSDILSFTSLMNLYDVPLIDWIDNDGFNRTNSPNP